MDYKLYLCARNEAGEGGDYTRCTRDDCRQKTGRKMEEKRIIRGKERNYR